MDKTMNAAVPLTPVESAIADLKGVLDSGDAEQIKSKSEALTQLAMKMGEQLYKAQQETAASGSTAPESPAAEPGVVDAEFSEVKDDKKSA
jgi:molecular chaperone DnaK